MIQKERNRAGRSGTLMKSVYHSLKEDICNGVIKTGELLSEAQLAERLSVSRTPVREALAALENEGLVRTERTAGRFVTEDTALIEQLRADTAQTLAADFLEKMRGIGYSPAQAAALLEHWDAKENRDE